MIYAVLVRPSNNIRGFYTEEKAAQEHADFINNHREGSFRQVVSAKVITILQEHDKEKAAQE
jgi:hypothetical protein